MFATLLGALPRPDDQTADIDRLVEIAVRAQEEAALEPITDGRVRDPSFDRMPSAREVVERWRSTAAMTDRAVKQALPGPITLGGGQATTDAVAEAAAALAKAGCPLVEIEERAVDRLSDEGERRRFRDVHERVLEKVQGTHLSLSIVGGAPPESAWDTILTLPYASLAVDLIAGPENWNLVTRLATDRGVIAGAESAREADEPKELLLWAAQYAATTNGRGRNRVGLGSAGSYANLTWEVALRKMRLLGEAARLASMPAGPELGAALEPKAVSIRAAALGTTARPRRRKRRGC